MYGLGLGLIGLGLKNVMTVYGGSVPIIMNSEGTIIVIGLGYPAPPNIKNVNGIIFSEVI